MITQAKERTAKEILNVLDPLVKEWFFSRFKDFSIPQLYGVLPVHERKNILISAPTGGTKTLTSFLSILNYLVSLARKNELENKIYCIYVSPLKALNNDIAVNLIEPLQEMKELAEKRGIELQDIRVGVRTGDTPADERQKMLKRAPHILVTTPESLSIVLTTTKFIELMKAVEFCIIDEIHALANKRGAYLSLTLERLQHISIFPLTRIGLSATVSPLEVIAGFLTGYEHEKGDLPRDCMIADVQFTKKLDMKVLSPVQDMINITSQELQKELYGLIDRLIQEHKTTLIFTNTRSATERVVAHLKEMFPGKYLDDIGAHHSSLSREHRFDIEKRLREGKLKVVVTSTSLELGIDIGYVDLVILLGSPKSVARCLQRTGRAGHKLHEIAKGRLIVMDQDDLVECSVMLKEAIEKKIDKVQIPRNSLDVLCQQVFGMAIQQKWKVDELFNVVRKSYCYHSLSREDFFSVISYLSGEYALEARNVYAKIWYDPETKELGKRGALARVIYMTNIGTIPDESFINVVIAGGERKDERVGVIDEGFLERMKQADVFVLGGNKYEFLYTRGMNVYVKTTLQRQPTIPSWFSEMLPLSFDLAMSIQRFRKLVAEMFQGKKKEKDIKDFMERHLYIDRNSVDALYTYFLLQNEYAKIPHESRLLIEQYFDRGKNYLLFHSLYGRRVNDALSRALAYLIAKLGGRDVEIGINDNGFFLASLEKMNIDKALSMLNESNIQEILEEAVENTEIFKRRFRHCAARSLMILRNYKGRSKSVGMQQFNSGFLLGTVRKLDSNFPILKETRREILEDLMDIVNAKKVLRDIESRKIAVERIQSDIPSPFSLNLILQGHSDLMKIEDKMAFLRRMYAAIKENVGEGEKKKRA